MKTKTRKTIDQEADPSGKVLEPQYGPTVRASEAADFQPGRDPDPSEVGQGISVPAAAIDVCHFCQAPAAATCCQPVNGLYVTTWELVGREQIVERLHQERVTSTVARVVWKRPVATGQLMVYLLMIPTVGPTRTKEIYVYPFEQVRAKGLSRCGLPCCERHLQERGEGRHICQSHWGAWEKTAAA